MKILFASDISFNYFPEYVGDEKAVSAFSEVAGEFRKVDFSRVNLENILGNREDYEPIEKSGPNLIAEDGFIKYIDTLNPSVVGLANNHTCDYGEGAMFHTMDMLRAHGYQMCGAGKNIDEAYLPAVFQKDGVKVYVIAVCENEFGVAKKNLSGTAGYNLTRVKNAIKSAILEGAKPIVYFHGGNEKNPFPSPGKKELYRLFVDMGAVAVIAMHTHCPQGYEIYEGAPIIYSMSNFYFPKPSTFVLTPSWSIGYMTMLDITEDELSFELIPYKFDMEGLYLLKGAEKENFMKYINELCAPIGDDDKLQEYFDAWCTMTGIGVYSNSLVFKDEMVSGASCTGLKNLLSCEAHNELMINSMKILFEKRYEEAKKYVPYIEKLQNIKL